MKRSEIDSKLKELEIEYRISSENLLAQASLAALKRRIQESDLARWLQLLRMRSRAIGEELALTSSANTSPDKSRSQ